MEFFDRKEEVLEIELTQHGKRLLSMGEFKPYYYQFFDDDILYETAGSGFSERQNESIPRIKETPRIKTQSIVYGLETELNKLKQDLDTINNINKSKKPKEKKKYAYNKNHDPLKFPLGLGDFSRNYTPAWDIKFIDGIISTSSFSSTYSPEADYYEYIPQISCTSSILYQYRNDPQNYDFISDIEDYRLIYKSDLYQNKTYFVIYEKGGIEAAFKELNSTFDKENFDIEVFEVEKVDGQKEDLKKLYFFQNDVELNNLIIENENIEEAAEDSTEEGEALPYDVEWYFSIANDAEIDQAEEDEGILEDIFEDEDAENSEGIC